MLNYNVGEESPGKTGREQKNPAVRFIAKIEDQNLTKLVHELLDKSFKN